MPAQGKTGYRTYRFYTDKIIRNHRAALKISKKKIGKKETIFEILRLLDKHQPNYSSTIEFSFLAEEHNWLHHSDKPIVFPANEDLLALINRAKVDSAGLQFEPLWSSYLLAFPKTFKVLDKTIEGCLITHQPYSERENMINRFLTGAGLDPVSTYSPDLTDRSELILTMNYCHEVEGGQMGYFRLVLRQSQMNYILSSKTVEEYAEKLGSLPMHQQQEFKLDQSTHKIQFELAKLVTKMLVYIQALKNEVLKEGYPTTGRPNIEGAIVNGRAKDYTISPNFTGSQEGDRSFHLRTYYFRPLVHEKYYKSDEWKHKPRGTRVIFVRESSVGEKVDPHTLE